MKRTGALLTTIAIAALVFPAAGGASTVHSGVIRAPRETSHFTFYAKPKRVETECEPTTAKALLIGNQRSRIPALFSNNAGNGSVYVYERRASTCVSVVNWSAHRVIIHFTLVLLDTTTQL